MGRAKYVVELAEEERVRLRSLLRGGKASVRMVTRARVLLKADEGYTDGAIAAALEVATATVGRIRKRLVEEGLEHALREQPRPGQRRKLSGKQEAPCDRGGMQYPAWLVWMVKELEGGFGHPDMDEGRSMSWSWPRRSGCGCGPCCGVAKLPFAW